MDVDNYDALIILLQYSADTNISKRNRITPLLLAAKKNKENYISALLRNKANPNLQNKLYSQTPTHHQYIYFAQVKMELIQKTRTVGLQYIVQ